MTASLFLLLAAITIPNAISWTLIAALWLRLDASERRAVLTDRGLYK